MIPLVMTFCSQSNRRAKKYPYTLIRPNSGKIEESLTVGSKVLFHHAADKWMVPPEVVALPNPNGIMLGALPGLQESTFAYFALRSGIGCYDFPGNVLQGNGQEGHPADQGFADRADNYLLVAQRILSDLSKAQS